MIDILSYLAYRAQYNRGEITLDEFKERVERECTLNQAIHDAHFARVKQWLNGFVGNTIEVSCAQGTMVLEAYRETIPWNIGGEGEVKS